MTSNALPNSKELSQAMIAVLRTAPDGKNTQDLDNEVALRLNLSPEQLAFMHSGNRTEFAYRMAWERTHAKNKAIIERVGARIWKIK